MSQINRYVLLFSHNILTNAALMYVIIIFECKLTFVMVFNKSLLRHHFKDNIQLTASIISMNVNVFVG